MENGTTEENPKKSLSEKDYSSLGDYVRNLRDKNNMTQTELAERVGTSQSYIADIEKNKVTPRPAMLDKVSKILDVDRDYMYIMADKWPPSVPKTKGKLNLLKESKKVEGISFASFIKSKRKQLNMTQQEVADLVGISQSFYAELEGEKYKDLSARIIKSLASVLNEDANTLLALLPK